MKPKDRDKSRNKENNNFFFSPSLGNTPFNNFQRDAKRESEEIERKEIQFDTRERYYQIYENELLTVKAVPIKHSIFTLGYVIEEKPVRGRMLIEKIKEEHGISPGPQLRKFIEKEEFVTDSGKLVKTANYFGPAKKSRKIVILGDTFDPSNISSIAMNADILVHEATCSNEEKNIALEFGHSTAGMAGEFAKRISAKNLIITHFSPRNFSNECKKYSLSFLSLPILSLSLSPCL